DLDEVNGTEKALFLRVGQREVVDHLAVKRLAVFAERCGREEDGAGMVAICVEALPRSRFSMVSFIEEYMGEQAGKTALFFLVRKADRAHRRDDDVAGFQSFGVHRGGARRKNS